MPTERESDQAYLLGQNAFKLAVSSFGVSLSTKRILLALSLLVGTSMVEVSLNKNPQGYRPQDLWRIFFMLATHIIILCIQLWTCALISKIVFRIFPPTKNMPRNNLIRKLNSDWCDTRRTWDHPKKKKKFPGSHVLGNALIVTTFTPATDTTNNPRSNSMSLRFTSSLFSFL